MMTTRNLLLILAERIWKIGEHSAQL